MHGDPLHTDYIERAKADEFIEKVALVHTGAECLRWPFRTNPKGYAMLGRKLATRIICERLHGPPPTPDHEAAHECGLGTEACVAGNHLSWKTHAENMEDMVLHGTRRGKGRKLLDADVETIRDQAGQVLQRDIAVSLGVTQSHVSRIISKQRQGKV